MRVEIRIKPDELELRSVKFIESALSLGEATITEQGQAFWIFDSLDRALNVLASVKSVEKVRQVNAK